jgi:hypothetical protein
VRGAWLGCRSARVSSSSGVVSTFGTRGKSGNVVRVSLVRGAFAPPARCS